MENLSSEKLDRMQALSDAATPGQWFVGRWRQGDGPWAPTISPEGHGASICRFDRHGAPHKDAADANFIAEARAFIPKALPALRHLLNMQGQASEALEKMKESDKVLAELSAQYAALSAPATLVGGETQALDIRPDDLHNAQLVVEKMYKSNSMFLPEQDNTVLYRYIQALRSALAATQHPTLPVAAEQPWRDPNHGPTSAWEDGQQILTEVIVAREGWPHASTAYYCDVNERWFVWDKDGQKNIDDVVGWQPLPALPTAPQQNTGKEGSQA